ncbi:MAG TPA: hypothetical protein VK285_04465 [Gaiellaceae bacterium]|nr:hypothetical protein [Gaiellaceae bacterium]
MRRLGLSAAVAAFALTAGACTGSKASAEHSCGALDKRFIQTAGLNMTALGIWASGYQDGAIDPAEMAAQARDAARRVSYTEPHDPSLRRARVLIDAMFLEYGDAVAHLASGKPDAGKRMFRAYGLANFAREILVDAQPELAKRGCNVAALL